MIYAICTIAIAIPPAQLSRATLFSTAILHLCLQRVRCARMISRALTRARATEITENALTRVREGVIPRVIRMRLFGTTSFRSIAQIALARNVEHSFLI